MMFPWLAKRLDTHFQQAGEIMKRRTFIKTVVTGALSGMALVALPAMRAGAGFLLPQPPVFIKALGKSFQGTHNGQVYASLDGGLAWHKLADFGSHCSIQAIYERQGFLYLQVGVQKYSFYLKSSDGRLWRTVDSIPAA